MRIALLLVLLLTVAAAPARGATVTYIPAPPDPPDLGPDQSCDRSMVCEPAKIAVVDGGAEPNRLHVVVAEGGVVIRDTGAALTASGCEKRDDGSVKCPRAVVSVSAGGGSDEVIIDGGIGARIDGGDGDDAITGATTLAGGAGADTLTGGSVVDGGPGPDTILNGPAGAWVTDDDPGPDRLEGGGGTDLLLMSGRKEPIHANLTTVPQTAGQAGEGNLVSGFEEIEGGRGNDVLTAPPSSGQVGSYKGVAVGGAGDDRLTVIGAPTPGVTTLLDGGAGDDTLTGAAGADLMHGGRGADVLRGAGGADTLIGDQGRDQLFGGAGNDRLYTRDRGRDVARCGTGRDRLFADRRDRSRGCERQNVR